jgi:hypothetical protein
VAISTGPSRSICSSTTRGWTHDRRPRKAVSPSPPKPASAFVTELLELRDQATDEATRKAIREKIQAAISRVERSVAVYGAINLRTDGEKVVMAQKLERPRPNGEKWDVHLLEPDESGELVYVGEE